MATASDAVAVQRCSKNKCQARRAILRYEVKMPSKSRGFAKGEELREVLNIQTPKRYSRSFAPTHILYIIYICILYTVYIYIDIFLYNSIQMAQTQWQCDTLLLKPFFGST